MPCRNCPRRSKCRKICTRLEAKLPKLHEPQFNNEDVQLLRVMRRRMAVRGVLSLRAHLTPRESEIINLTVNNGMTTWQASQALGISMGVLRRLLRQAHRRMRCVVREPEKERSTDVSRISG